MTCSIILKGNGTSRTIKSKVIQSPLAGVTDKTFRKFVRRWAPNSLLFTEMVNATSLKLGHGKEKITQIEKEEGPIGVQIFDNRPNAVAEAAILSEEAGAFLIDINMGCPVKKIARKGCGSALLKDPELAVKIVNSISKVVKIPITVKTRIGWSKDQNNIDDFVLRLQDAGASMITLHGRTREQGFSGKANWKVIKKLKEKLEIPVIANGDIFNEQDAIKCLKETNADGIMIGRGVLGSPWIIGRINSAIEGLTDFKEPSLEERLTLIIEHIEELTKEKGAHGLLIARKHISWSCKDFPNAKNLRHELVRVKTSDEAKYLLQKQISLIRNYDC